MNSFILGFITWLMLWLPSQASEFSAENHYSMLSERYIISLLDGNYQEAYSLAADQLGMDPSDVMAYLRLSIAAHHIKVDKLKIKRENAVSVAEGSAIEKQIKQLANALLGITETSE